MSKKIKTHGWIIDILVDSDKHLTVCINNNDKSKVSSLELDLAVNNEEWVQRFSSEVQEKANLDVEQNACSSLEKDTDTSSTDWQIETAIGACEVRIDNGADPKEAFKWLREEIAQIHSGVEVYD